jgi:hypothetical protein
LEGHWKGGDKLLVGEHAYTDYGINPCNAGEYFIASNDVHAADLGPSYKSKAYVKYIGL